jgi:hypothetical protein
MLHRASKVRDDRDRDSNIEEGRDRDNNIEEDRDRDNEYKHAKLMHVFGYELTSFSSLIQYLILASGMLLCMCLYGYYQELFVYGFFDRKLSFFATFIHFLGCSVFAQIQRRTSSSSSSSSNNNNNSINASIGSINESKSILSMGTASKTKAIGYYMLLVFSKTATQGLSNLSMTQINYPAKVLFKSANPIITMFIGIIWFKKGYPRRDYIVVCLLVLGLYVFMSGGSTSTPQGTTYGIMLVFLSMFGSASVPMIQEHCMNKYNASAEELIYMQYIGSSIVSFLLSLTSGEFFTGISFLISNGTFRVWISFIAFCSFGFAGANFSTVLTQHFGSLANGITSTFRKALTLCLSFALFPDRNKLSIQHLFGACIFFSGLIIRVLSKERFESKGKTKNLNN